MNPHGSDANEQPTLLHNHARYDAENRIASANGVTYTYDGNDLRVEKSSGTLYWRSIFGDALAESDLQGNITNEYVFFAGRRIARISSGTVNYFYSDALGTVHTITDATGNPCYDASFTPYGLEVPNPNITQTCSSNYKFTGYEYDSETGLYYGFARYYNPRLGRFMSADPWGGDAANPQTLNRYAYVVNNPSNFADPSGLWCDPGFTTCDMGITPTGLFEGSDEFDLINLSYTIPGNSYGTSSQTDNSIIVSTYQQVITVYEFIFVGEQDIPNIPWVLPNVPPDLPPGLRPQPFKLLCPVNGGSLDAYLSSKGSPMAGQGAALISAGQQNNVDPRFVVAIAGAESGFGNHLSRGPYNAWNWGTSGFSGWAAGISAVSRGLGTGPLYLNGRPPLTTTSSIYGKYCQGPDCANGLKNIDTFLRQQGGDTNSLRFPCKW